MCSLLECGRVSDETEEICRLAEPLEVLEREGYLPVGREEEGMRVFPGLPLERLAAAAEGRRGHLDAGHDIA
jgi:hypothetical protein